MKRPSLLITNDDSIDSCFLAAFVDAIKADFELTIAAPKGEKSWIGRAMSRRTPVDVAPVDKFPGCTAYSIDGTPSDCVNIALAHLMPEKPDIICSGINIGFNVSLPFVLSSGTIAGALEGALWGHRAIAFSMYINSSTYEALHHANNKLPPEAQANLSQAAEHTKAIIQNTLNTPVPTTPIVHNINFPMEPTPKTPILKTQPAPSKMGSLFAQDADGPYRFKYSEMLTNTDEQYDYGCIVNGKISHTVLDFSKLGIPA